MAGGGVPCSLTLQTRAVQQRCVLSGRVTADSIDMAICRAAQRAYDGVSTGCSGVRTVGPRRKRPWGDPHLPPSPLTAGWPTAETYMMFRSSN